MTNYSIIIPHRNIPFLLKRCLKSIPSRNDTEVIVVDDASEDVYVNEIENIVRSRHDVRLLRHYECMGGGVARNTGLSHAVGRYIIFADADDFFNDCFASILEEYKETDFEQIYFKGNSVDTDTMSPANRADHLNGYVDDYLSGKDIHGEQLRYLFGEPWARMIKREMIEREHIRFEETLIHNDTAFGYLTGYYARSIHADERALYCVTVRQGSVSVTTSTDRILTRIEVFGRAEQFLSGHQIKTQPDYHYEQMVRLLAHGRLNIFVQCIRVLHGQGFSILYILKRTFSKLFSIVKGRLYKS